MKHFLTTLLIVALVILICLTYSRLHKDEEVAVIPGQVWRYEHLPVDPFDKEHRTHYHQVLAIKDDFVQYVDLATCDTISMSIYWFKIESHLISSK